MLAELPAWMNTAWAYILVILGFSFVVFVHELGHFLAAKWAKVKVERFAIGFGRPLIAYRKGLGVRFKPTQDEVDVRLDQYLNAQGKLRDRRHIEGSEEPVLAWSDADRKAAMQALGLSETEYCFNVLPLGGYVKMLGQEDFVVDKTGELKVKANPDSFTSKPIGKRMVIVSAGVIMNLILAAIVFTVINMAGMPQPSPILGYVAENTPAGRAGLLPGDRILEINGDEIRNFNDLMMRITLSDSEEVLTMRVERDGKIVSPPPQIRPEFVEERELRQIGVAPGQTRRVWGLTLGDITASRPDELQENDEIHQIVIDGKPVDCRDAGVIRREMMRAEGRPIELIVKRPTNPKALTQDQLIAVDPPIETELVHVMTRAVWLPLPYDPNDRSGPSLLGLVPRLTILQSFEGKSFAKAGARAGDVIVRIGKVEYPTFAEFESAVKEAGSQGVEIEVRRKGAKRDGLSDAAMDFCVIHREELIRAGIEKFENARLTLSTLAKDANIGEQDLAALTGAVDKLANAEAWRKWFETVDTVKLDPINPKAPFALFSSPPPAVDAEVRHIDENHLVVASVVEKFGDRVTSARAAGIERGAVILSVNGERVREWYQLSHALEDNAGKKVEIEYRLVDRIKKTELQVPPAIQAELNVGFEDRIVKIDDKAGSKIKTLDGRELPVALPDWRAMEQLLKESIGKTVEVEYVTPDGVRKTATYPVTAQSTDPWLARVQYYAMTFVCYPLFESHPIPNPAKAFVVGVKQAYAATVATVQTIRHMLFTRNVGLSNVSGPLGIAHKGSQIAEGGVLALIWFMGLISANLAVINFLPLPIVDGGLFLFLVLEKIRGEPVSIKMQVATQLLGIALIATVFLLVTYQDILRLVTGT